MTGAKFTEHLGIPIFFFHFTTLEALLSFPLNKPMTQCQFQRECTRQWEMAAFRMSILGLKIHPMPGEGDPAWLALTLTNTITGRGQN